MPPQYSTGTIEVYKSNYIDDNIQLLDITPLNDDSEIKISYRDNYYFALTEHKMTIKYKLVCPAVLQNDNYYSRYRVRLLSVKEQKEYTYEFDFSCDLKFEANVFDLMLILAEVIVFVSIVITQRYF